MIEENRMQKMPPVPESPTGDARHIRRRLAGLRVAEVASLLGASIEAWNRHNAPRLGASLAFYTILSLAPLLIVVIAVAGLISGRAAAEAQIVWQIQNLAGGEGAEVIRQMLEGARKPATGILATTLGLLTLFLGATAVVGELRDILNTVWEIPFHESHWHKSILRILKERVFSFLMVLGVGFLLLASITANVWLAAAGAQIGGLHPLPESVLQALTSGGSLVLNALLFALIYKFMPDIHLEWRDVATGGVLTSLLFSLGKLLIALYLSKAGLVSIYGAAGSLVVLLVWIYYSAQVFLLGAEFTRVFARRYGRKATLRSGQ